jgi:hypothetical protein
MKSLNRNLVLALLLLCLAPASFASKPNRDRDRDRCDPRRDRKCQQVPEGGSAAIYLLGAGITCLGAIVIRSRSLKPSQS